jgi:hypothetical protein
VDLLYQIGGFIVLILGVLYGARRSGRQAERAEQNERVIDHVEKANEADRSVDAAGPADRQRLRDKWTRH